MENSGRSYSASMEFLAETRRFCVHRFASFAAKLRAPRREVFAGWADGCGANIAGRHHGHHLSTRKCNPLLHAVAQALKCCFYSSLCLEESFTYLPL